MTRNERLLFGVFIALMAVFLVFAILFFVDEVAHADARPLPSSQWTAEARLDLARSCAGEAGLRSGTTGECVAIAWVYARRFELTRARYPEMSFADVVRAYSSALKPPTQPWVPGLRADAKRPHGWPSRLSWERHAPLWSAILDAVDRWATGNAEDPCRGRAAHYGGSMDLVPAHWERIDCGATANRFYATEAR